MALELLIDTVDRISLLRAGSLFVTQTREGLNSTCAFDLHDQGVFQKDAWTVEETRVEDGDVITGYIDWGNQPKVEVKVCDGATTYFAGILSRTTVTHMGKKNQVVNCECHDFTQVLEESVVDTLEEYADKTDEFIIDDIFTNYVTGINFADHVATVGTIDVTSYEGITVRKVLDLLASQTGAVWYVDYDKKLHYNAAGADAPAWYLSDNPDQVNSFSYFDDISRERCATNLINRVFVIGEAASTWYEDADSVAEWGTHRFIFRDQNLVEIADMAAVAARILTRCKDPIDTYSLSTYKDGLRAGMKVRVVCAFYDVDDTFLIDSLIVTFPPDKEPVYRITCGGTTSSPAAVAQRLAFDDAQDWRQYVTPSLVLASRGWSHSIDFTPSDQDTVAWDAGTIYTAAGPTFNIVLGNTGNMAAVTFVFLDTAVSTTVLQTTTVQGNCVGINRILVAVCWPSGVVGVNAAHQVFGGGAGVPTMLNAYNIVANALTANEIAANTISAAEIVVGTITAVEIFGNTLSVIAADMGTLNAGTINMFAGVWGANATGFRLNATEIASQAAGVDQVVISSATGLFTAGAGALILDATGIRFVGAGASGNTRTIRFMYDDAGTERLMGSVYSDWGGGAGLLRTHIMSWREAGSPWPRNTCVDLIAKDSINAVENKLAVYSDGIAEFTGCTIFATSGEMRVSKGLHVGSLAASNDNDITCDGTIATAGGSEWDLQGYSVGTVANTGKITVVIDGSLYRIACRAV